MVQTCIIIAISQRVWVRSCLNPDLPCLITRGLDTEDFSSIIFSGDGREVVKRRSGRARKGQAHGTGGGGAYRFPLSVFFVPGCHGWW